VLEELRRNLGQMVEAERPQLTAMAADSQIPRPEDGISFPAQKRTGNGPKAGFRSDRGHPASIAATNAFQSL